MKGTTFELSSEPMFSSLSDEEEEDMFWDKEQDPNTFKSPCVTSLMELKASMAEISDGIFKRIEKKPEQGAKKVDLDRQRITYHRNMYSEGEDYPFDSTYLNGETDEVCLPLKKDSYLEGFLEALSSMKEGEQSLFVISYKKMFKELGCPPRVRFFILT